jgi:hypothetical protein
MTRGQALPAALAAVLACVAAPAAADRECEHVVQPGDTLGAIARDRLGDGDVAPILELNRETLSDPDRIRPGQVLRLPCPEETPTPAAPSEAEAPPAPGAAPPEEAAPGPDRAGAVRAFFGGDASALAAARGLRDLVAEALAEADSTPPPSDRDLPPAGVEAALERTGPNGPWHISYPWIAPDCARLDRLPPALARRCATLDFSSPLATLRFAWIVRPESAAAAAQGPEALRGLTLCRPEGAFDGDLAADGLAPPRARRLAPPDAAACLAAVAEGAADVASLAADEARAALADRSPDAPALAENAALASSVTLHAAARRDSPFGRAALAALDSGLAAIRTARSAPPPTDPVRER